jgi:hypothetical protein
MLQLSQSDLIPWILTLVSTNMFWSKLVRFLHDYQHIH